jgi:hypothetical protein
MSQDPKRDKKLDKLLDEAYIRGGGTPEDPNIDPHVWLNKFVAAYMEAGRVIGPSEAFKYMNWDRFYYYFLKVKHGS